jgi:uncharacterized protein YbjT (DUF2867 family)
MKVLVTGGTGVVGTAAVRSLLAASCAVRLFSRHAARDAARFGEGVEIREGSVTSPEELRGAAEGCHAVLHIAGIAEENPPEATFDRINVGGTRNLIEEAERSGAFRFVYVSSLGADRGSSAYHASKREAEQLVRGFRGDWLICRPGNVYGPGDEVVSFLLQVVRTSPAAPVLDGGDQPFQPLWADDLGAALALAVTRKELTSQILLLAGPEVTTTHDLLDRLGRLTGQSPIRIPIPSALASLGAQAASLVGLRLPVDENKVAMLVEENVLQPGEINALTDVFGIFPTRLDEGLARLANSQPEQLPDEEGTGPLVRRIFYAFLTGVRRSPADLFEGFRRHFTEIVPDSTMGPAKEPVAESWIEKGATLTLSLPMRGHVQVRVVEITGTSMTYATIAGHPLAGTVTFRFIGVPGEDLRFEVEACDRPASPPDALAMYPLGILMKRWNWSKVVERAADFSGALPPIEVKTSEQTLTGEQEQEAVEEIRQQVDTFARDEEKTLEMEAKMRLETAARTA